MSVLSGRVETPANEISMKLASWMQKLERTQKLVGDLNFAAAPVIGKVGKVALCPLCDLVIKGGGGLIKGPGGLRNGG